MSDNLSLLEPSLPQKIFLDRREFAALTGLSVGMIDKMIRAGQIKVRRAGDRVLIFRDQLLTFGEETTYRG